MKSHHLHNGGFRCNQHEALNLGGNWSSRSLPALKKYLAPRKILNPDAFVAIIGYVRTYDIQLLNHPEELRSRNQRERPLAGMSQDQPIAYEKGCKLRTFSTRPGEQVSPYRKQGTQEFDAIFDFATSLQYPEDETKLRSDCNFGDDIHPNDAGYQRMAEAVDLTQLTGSPTL